MRLLRSTAIALALALGFFLPAPGPITGIVFNPAAYADPITGKIPDWISTACCGPSHAHRLRVDAAQRREDGAWIVDGYPWPVPNSIVKPSQDGNVWAFYAEGAASPLSAAAPSHMYCLFVPEAT